VKLNCKVTTPNILRDDDELLLKEKSLLKQKINSEVGIDDKGISDAAEIFEEKLVLEDDSNETSHQLGEIRMDKEDCLSEINHGIISWIEEEKNGIGGQTE